MSNFKDQWNFEMAMEVLQNPTIDSKIWAEAVKWLLLYGPPEISDHIQKASGIATSECFPDLKPIGFTEDGEPCYSLEELARELGISEEEAKETLSSVENDAELKQVYDSDEAKKVQ